ncbi:MAG: ABC transporter substrate-binding protein [Firmicutes bacterium]|nr:ABC transporter substrate-binding protein [Bacillota bacterium]
MLKRARLALALILVVTLAFGASITQAQSPSYDMWGPKVDEIIMPIIKDQEAQRIAFERGDSVVLPGLTRPVDIDWVKTMPNADVTMTLGFHMFYLCFNMRTNPLDAEVVRQAVAHCVDRDNIIRTLFKGYMLPMTSFVPRVSPFYKDDVPTFPYSHAKAAEILDKAGYKLDPVTKVRIDPTTGKPMREVKILTPTYEVAATSAEIGKIIAESCQAVGLPVKPEPMDFPVMLDKLDRAEFDMYVLAWSLSKLPTSLYNFFHSSNDVEAGYNRPGIRMPALDQALEQLMYAPDLATARAGSDKAQMILAKAMPYVPLYSRPYIDAFRKDIVAGYVPMKGFGAAQARNLWTSLNIRRTAGPGGTIRWLLPEEPKNFNLCTASSAYAWEVLYRVWGSLVESDPETLEDIPWMAKKWDVGVWEPEPGKKGTVITWYLHDGIKWQDGMPFTSEDIKFTIEFLKSNKVPRYLTYTQDIVKVETPDKLTAKVYFSNVSYWHFYDADLSFLPKHIWKDVKDYKTFEPWNEPHPTVPGLTKVIGTGPFILKEYRPGEYVRLVKNPNYWRLTK